VGSPFGKLERPFAGISSVYDLDVISIVGLTVALPLRPMAIMLLITVAAFWCSCMRKSTISAVLWVFPILFAISLAVAGGIRTAESMGISDGWVTRAVGSVGHLQASETHAVTAVIW